MMLGVADVCEEIRILASYSIVLRLASFSGRFLIHRLKKSNFSR